MKIKLILFILFLFVTEVYSQSLSSYQSDLNSIRYDCRNVFIKSVNTDELEDMLKKIHDKVSELVDELKEFDYEDSQYSEYKNLLLEAEELEDFTADNNTCECLRTFNKLMNYLSTQNGLVIEKDGVRVYKAEIGNFIFYYAYGLEKKLNRVSVELQKVTQNGHSTATKNFGLANEIEVIKIVPKSESWKIKSMNIESSSKLDYIPSKCGSDYPRY